MRYVLPGMGATSEMYQGCWRDLANTRFLDWPAHAGETEIRQVAGKLIDIHGISGADSVAGSSLGGVVALELHSMLKLREVILIGSAIKKEEINSLLMLMAPLASITPVRLTQILAGKSESAVAKMFSGVEASFVTAMCRALSHWEGYHGNMDRVRRIHGAKDKVIPCPKHVDSIPGGGHLIAMTHAEACVKYVNMYHLKQ